MNFFHTSERIPNRKRRNIRKTKYHFGAFGKEDRKKVQLMRRMSTRNADRSFTSAIIIFFLKSSTNNRHRQINYYSFFFSTNVNIFFPLLLVSIRDSTDFMCESNFLLFRIQDYIFLSYDKMHC